MKKRIFTYWVNKAGSGVPGYVQLCMQTWFEHITGLELVVINHDNLREWADCDIDFTRFLWLSLPMQSDVASMLILKKHGGVFMDADTIVTKDIFDEVERMDSKQLTAFGYPEIQSVHMAVFISLLPRNPFISAAANIALKRVNGLNPGMDINWDYFGNDIINLVKKDKTVQSRLRVLDRTESGNILESNFFADVPNTAEQYIKFYFTPNDISVDEAVGKIQFGAVSLHNSWTPAAYKKYTPEQVIESDVMLSRILKHSLADFLNA